MDQSETIAFVKEALEREAGAPAVGKQTHVSQILLAGDLVFKLKRAVAFPYLDFSTPEAREKACRAEFALNSRGAPDLYLGVRRVTREKDGLAFDGPGPLVDCVVVMRRFDEADLFDVMAREHRLTPDHIEALAETLARFHANAERFPKAEGAAAMAHVLDLNEISFAQASIFPSDQLAELHGRFRAELRRLAPLLDARAEKGFVRLCHGDLYLRNICLFDGKPTLFDCIEFDEKLARIDVLYDLAFALMDLWLIQRRDLANLLFNRYVSALARTLPDIPARIRDGYAALPFFMALRAAIRAHIAASQAQSGDAETDGAHRLEALAYFALARDLLEPRPKALIVIGGLSGSGKSTLTAAVAGEIGQPPGARTLNSDRTRKAMHKLKPNEPLPPEAYEPSVTAAVYARLIRRAHDALAQDAAVIVDAVFSTEEERAAIKEPAREAGVPFVGLWLEAQEEILRQRVRDRPKGPSDADILVLESQLARDVGNIDWIRLDSTRPDLVEATVAILSRALEQAEQVA